MGAKRTNAHVQPPAGISPWEFEYGIECITGYGVLLLSKNLLRNFARRCRFRLPSLDVLMEGDKHVETKYGYIGRGEPLVLIRGGLQHVYVRGAGIRRLPFSRCQNS